jgi:hypothetical protein
MAFNQQPPTDLHAMAALVLEAQPTCMPVTLDSVVASLLKPTS